MHEHNYIFAHRAHRANQYLKITSNFIATRIKYHRIFDRKYKRNKVCVVSDNPYDIKNGTSQVFHQR